MLTNILLPTRFLKIGWFVLIPFGILLFATNYFDFSFAFLDFPLPVGGFFQFLDQNFTNELALLGVFIGLFFVSFSKQKEEDEFIQKLRLESLLIAFYIHTFILVLGTLLFYGLVYLEFMGYNMFTLQIIFILRFQWVLNRERKSLQIV